MNMQIKQANICIELRNSSHVYSQTKFFDNKDNNEFETNREYLLQWRHNTRSNINPGIFHIKTFKQLIQKNCSCNQLQYRQLKTIYFINLANTSDAAIGQ